MGVVHLARRGDGPRVALKVLRPHIVGDDEARRRLEREVGSLSRIRSKWVAEIVDADPWAPVPYVATRYVPGLSLHDYVHEEGPIEGKDLTWFAACLAEGVASVHAVGVLHRDVKPSNVLMEGRTPILIDFGLARVADDPKLTHTGWLLGHAGLPRARDPARRRRHHGLRRALVGGHRRLRRDRQAALRPRAVDGDHGPGPPRRAPPLRHPRAAAPAPRRLPPPRRRAAAHAGRDPGLAAAAGRARRSRPAAASAGAGQAHDAVRRRPHLAGRPVDRRTARQPTGRRGRHQDAHRAPDRDGAGPARAPAPATCPGRAGPSAVRRTGPARDPARGRRAAVRRHRGGLPLVRLGRPPAARLAAAQRLAGRQRGGRTAAGARPEVVRRRPAAASGRRGSCSARCPRP